MRNFCAEQLITAGTWKAKVENKKICCVLVHTNYILFADDFIHLAAIQVYVRIRNVGSNATEITADAHAGMNEKLIFASPTNSKERKKLKLINLSMKLT